MTVGCVVINNIVLSLSSSSSSSSCGASTATSTADSSTGRCYSSRSAVVVTAYHHQFNNDYYRHRQHQQHQVDTKRRPFYHENLGLRSPRHDQQLYCCKPLLSSTLAIVPQQQEQQQHENSNKIVRFSRHLLLAMLLTTATTTTTFASTVFAIERSDTTAPAPPPISIVACSTGSSSSSSSSSSGNCVSTASVKQVDLFMLPWTWSDTISSDEVISRLKGVIAADQTLSFVDSTNVPVDDSSTTTTTNRNNYFVRVRAARNVCTDEIEFLINPTDRVITFKSQQVDGPDNFSDFGANRRRLDDIRKRWAVVSVLGGIDDSYYNSYTNGESREGLAGQLKAFWGFQSGGGFESILLDEDE